MEKSVEQKKYLNGKNGEREKMVKWKNWLNGKTV